MARLKINYYSVKSNLWLNKGTKVELLQFVGSSYVLVGYEENQVILPLAALEVIKDEC